ncbi:hypothetical protein NXS19_010738 [Fusarium pseudograminearum]|nr:hypothetical protein NXS19_010738 [Fusarium pseudograminearum]
MPLHGASRGYPSTRTVIIQALDSSFTNGRRTWNAELLENGQKPKSITIQDPLNEEDYLHHNINVYRDNDGLDFLDNLERGTIIQTYFDSLAVQLGLPTANDTVPSNDVIETTIALKIYVSDARTDAPFSIHSLMWELLEHQDYTKYSGMRILIIHTTNILLPQNRPFVTLHTSSFKKPLRILLVVSRSWQIREDLSFTDLSPSLVLNTLSYLSDNPTQGGRPFVFHVVRPGTLDSLEESLDRATALNQPYDLIHFDVHGRIATNGEPELLFARPYRPTHPNNTTNDDTFDFSEESFEVYGVQQLASLLNTHGIPAVVFNSCNSAYAQNGFISNLCLRLMQHGVQLVAGMNFAIRYKDAKIYHEGFYTSLLVDGSSFEQAAADGRAHLRAYHTGPLREAEHEPSALPLVYKIADSPTQAIKSFSVLERWFKFFTLWEWFVIILYYLSCVKPEWDAMGNTSQWVLVQASVLIEFIYSLCLLLDVVNVRWNPFAAQCRTIDRKTILDHFLHESSPSIWQGIGMTAIEEQLKLGSTHSAYIQMENSQSVGENSPFESYLKTLQTTGFAKDITIVQGADLDTPYWYFECYLKRRVLLLHEYFQSQAHRLMSFLTRTWMDQHRATPIPPLPSMFVFTDFDLIFERYTPDEVRDRALQRISMLRQIVPNSPDPFLLFIGTSRVPWEQGGIDPDHYYWSAGRKFIASASCERGIYDPTYGY